MAKLEFEDLSFEEQKGKVRVNFLRLFYFELEREELEKISSFVVEKNAITFKDMPEKKARNKFNFLLEKGFKELKNSLNGNKAEYVHQNSGIPLIGSLAFGIVDRGTDMIEVKPITSCPLNCIFCSVDDGLGSKKEVDFVVEKDYMVNELKKLIDYKNCPVDVYINPHGEPLLYEDIVPLVDEIYKIRHVGVLSIITSGSLLTKKLADELVKAGLNRLNLSLNAIKPEIARKLAGTAHYDVEHVKEMAAYTAKKIKVVIAPVYVPGFNDEEIPKLIEFANKINASIFIQNFLCNKRGRNPAKELPMGEFYSLLKELENRYSVKLIADCKLVKTKELPKPFKKGDVVKAEIICQGRYKNEGIAAANGRVITIPDCYKTGTVSVKILRSKYNVFVGRLTG